MMRKIDTVTRIMKQKRLISIVLTLAMSAYFIPYRTAAQEEVQISEVPYADEMLQKEPAAMEDAEEVIEETEDDAASVSETDEENIWCDEDTADFSSESNAVFPYIDGDGKTQYADCTSLDFVFDTENVTLEEGWYLVPRDRTFKNRLNIAGNVNLILADGITLNMEKGIHHCKENWSNLCVYAQSKGDSMGKMICRGGKYQAGIGGDDDETGGSLFVFGGAIEAYGGYRCGRHWRR